MNSYSFAKFVISSLVAFSVFHISAKTHNVIGDSTDDIFSTVVFDSGDEGSKFYRIPAIATAADGTIVAVSDKRGDSNDDLPNTISVVARLSHDGGRSWSDQIMIAEGDSVRGTKYGDAALGLDRNTGDLVCVFSGDEGFWTSTHDRHDGFYVSRSKDNGKTWTEPTDISDYIYKENWHGAFCASGRLHQAKDGRLMFVANTRITPEKYDYKNIYEFVCASSDGGYTWEVLNEDARVPYAANGNETKIFENAAGNLVMSIRTRGRRIFAESFDGGKTWPTEYRTYTLIEPGCNGDVLSWTSPDGKALLLHSVPSDPKARRGVSIYVSENDGKTWEKRVVLCEGSSAYSALTVLPDDSIGALVEEDLSPEGEPECYRLVFHRIPSNQL